MIPRTPAPLLLACLLAFFVRSHATTIDDFTNLVMAPYLQDTVFGSGTGGSVRHEFESTVAKRDAKGRPLLATYAQYPDPSPDSTQVYDIQYTWGLPVDLPFRNWGMQFLPTCLGCASWPSNIRLHIRTKGVTFALEHRQTWNPTTLSLVGTQAGVDSTLLTEGPCPWYDSLVFDASGRPILQVRCVNRTRTEPATARRVSMRLHYDNATDERPRWTSEHSDDTSVTIDSVHYIGPTSAPTHMILTVRKGGDANSAITTRTDSLVWDDKTRLVSHIYDVGTAPVPANRIVEKYTWVTDRLRTATAGFYRTPDLSTPTSVLTAYSFGYGVKGTAVERPTARPQELRRTANGRIVVPRRGTSPLHAEWSGLDGRRQSLAIVPEGDAAAVSFLAPRGVGILRLTQDGRTMIHPVATF